MHFFYVMRISNFLTFLIINKVSIGVCLYLLINKIPQKKIIVIFIELSLPEMQWITLLCCKRSSPTWSVLPLTLPSFSAGIKAWLNPLFLTWHYLTLGLQGGWEIWVTKLEIGAHQTVEQIPVLLLGPCSSHGIHHHQLRCPWGEKSTGSCRWQQGHCWKRACN